MLDPPAGNSAPRWLELRAAVVTTLDALRAYRGTALLMAAAVAVALASVLPVTSLFDVVDGELRPSLQFQTIRGGDLGLLWSSQAQPPAVVQQHAVNTLAGMLLGTALATLAIAAVTILIICLWRESARSGELRIQRAVGANRRVLIHSALLEGILIAVGGLTLGAVAGLAIAAHAKALWPGILVRGHPALDLMAGSALAVIVLLASLFPVLFPKRRVAEFEAHASTPVVPTVFQLGISLVALTSGALVTRHAAELTTFRNKEANQAAVLPITLAEHLGVSERASSYDRLLQRLAQAGLDSVGLMNPGAILGLGPVGIVTTDCGLCAENGMWLRWRLKPATYQLVSSDTFGLLGIQLLEGRGLTSADRWGAPGVAVISKSLAIREFQDGHAIGRRINAVGDWETVVGVVEDPAPVGLGGALQPRYAVYLSVLQHPPQSADLLVRSPVYRNRPLEIRRMLQTSLAGHIDRAQTEASLFAAEAARLAWFGRLFAVEGWAMLGIAVTGAFALMWLWVQSLTGELGLRRAMGARQRHLVGFVLIRAVSVGMAGIVIGLWFGSAVWGALPSVMTGARTWDPVVFFRFAAVLVASSVAGALLPAFQAARKTPAALISSSDGRS
jgi:hypothetical protein